MKIILASASPRRQELLKRIFSEFEIIPSVVDETVPFGMIPEEAPKFLAEKKADFLSESHPDDLVIAADTVVISEGKILGKPTDDEDAFQMLSTLSEKTHKVVTGCCIRYQNKTITFSEESLVSFYPLSRKDIKQYLATGEHKGKAGSYAIQGQGALFVREIKGDFYNIVGLPIARLNREIASLKINWR